MKIKMKREIGKQGKQRIEMVKPNENRTSTENTIHKKKKKAYQKHQIISATSRTEMVKPQAQVPPTSR